MAHPLRGRRPRRPPGDGACRRGPDRRYDASAPQRPGRAGVSATSGDAGGRRRATRWPVLPFVGVR